VKALLDDATPRTAAAARAQLPAAAGTA
jgi:hypothetical protein